jgi:hypothetical protein
MPSRPPAIFSRLFKWVHWFYAGFAWLDALALSSVLLIRAVKE